MVGRALSISIQDTMNSLSSPYYCVAWSPNMTQSFETARIYNGVTNLDNNLCLFITVRWND